MRPVFDFAVSCFGFKDGAEFANSLLHIKLIALTLPIATVSVMVETYLGLQSYTLVAFMALILLELGSGLVAAKVKKEKIQSRKFGRFGLKIFVWLTLLFVVHMLQQEYGQGHRSFDELANTFFDWLHGVLFIYINLEYMISVLENLAVITGKKNSGLVDAIQKKAKSLFGIEVDED